METMKFSTLFETLTQTRLKDCFKEKEGIVFVVQPGYMAKAIGKYGINVKKMQGIIKKDVRLIEFNPEVKIFIKNMLSVENVQISEDGEDIVIECQDARTKGQVFGREKERLKSMIAIVKRYFKINDIRVV